MSNTDVMLRLLENRNPFSWRQSLNLRMGENHINLGSYSLKPTYTLSGTFN